MARMYLHGIGFMLTGVLGIAFPGAAQEMKILREMDRDPLLSGVPGDLLQHPAGDIAPIMRVTKTAEAKDVEPKVELDADKPVDVEKASVKPSEDDGRSQVDSKVKNGEGSPEVSAAASPAAKNIFTLGVIDGESDNGSSTVTIRMDRKIDWKEVALENHNTYLQIPLPHTLVPESGKFIDINSPYITKAALLQITPERGAVRLFLAREFAVLESSLHADILGDRIVVTLDHNILEKKGIFDHVQKTGVKGTPQVSEVIAKTQVRSDIPDPAAGIKMDKDAKEKDASVVDNLPQKTKLVAILSAVIFFGFVGLSFMRSLFIRLRSPSGQENEYVMKTIASSHLAPKHKLTLMQIGDERILLSVSPDGIKYLTTISQKEAKSENFPMLQGKTEGGQGQYQEAIAKKPLLMAAAGAYRGMAAKQGTVATPDMGAVRRPTSGKSPVDEAQLTLDSRSTNGKRVNAVISDEGIRDLRGPYRDGSAHESAHAAKAIEDVTTLIRKKIKNLPTF